MCLFVHYITSTLYFIQLVPDISANFTSYYRAIYHQNYHNSNSTNYFESYVMICNLNFRNVSKINSQLIELNFVEHSIICI